MRTSVDGVLSAEVPGLLRQVFDEDFERLLRANAGSKITHNVTCLQPEEGMGARVFDEELRRLPLQPGRRCEGGCCADACSRVFWPTFATASEAAEFRALADGVMPPLDECLHHNMYLMACCASGSARTTLSFVRLVERLRRALAHEYGIPLASIAPMQCFVSRLDARAGDSTRQSLHVDESSFATFHYSGVLYLSSQGDEFEGGSFGFVETPHTTAAAARATPRRPAAVTPVREVTPVAGAALTFSSGWENPHAVAPLHAGCRYALPAFFRTSPAAAAESGGEARVADAERAQALWRSALWPQSEEAVRDLFRHWHAILATPP